jgi:hypothetical protein
LHRLSLPKPKVASVELVETSNRSHKLRRLSLSKPGAETISSVGRACRDQQPNPSGVVCLRQEKPKLCTKPFWADVEQMADYVYDAGGMRTHKASVSAAGVT